MQLAVVVIFGSHHLVAAGLVGGIIFVNSVAARPPARLIGISCVIGIVELLVARNISQLPPFDYGVGAISAAMCFLPFALRPLAKSSGPPILHIFGLLAGTYIVISTLFSTTLTSAVPTVTNHDRLVGSLLTGIFVVL